MAILTDEDRRRMGTVDPALAAELERNPFPELKGDTLTVRHVRAEHLKKLRHLYPIPGPIPDDVTETLQHVRARDGYEIPVKIYKPVYRPDDASPVVVMLHEGGWSMGDLTDEDLNCRMFSRDLGAVCVNVDYRLLPEYPWPCSVWDCWDVIQWVAETASPTNATLPADPKKGFIVGGASAGGNLSAVMCQLGRDKGLDPPLTGQYLACAGVLWSDAVPEEWLEDYKSRNSSSKDPILKAIANGDLPGLAGPGSTNPLFSPALHSNLKSLPPCYQQVAGLDPIRDEDVLYDHLLKQNGVKTRLEIYDGFGHMFWTNWPLLERSKEFVRDTLEGVKWLLSEGIST